MGELLKDIFFTGKTLSDLAFYISANYPQFDKDKFNRLVFDSLWNERELKAKMRHITLCLRETLPEDFKQSVLILKKVAPKITGFNGMIFPDYLEMYGIGDFDTSLSALAYFTKYSSSEFAVRPFILKDSKRVMSFMLKCAEDKNEHVRRFASEGCRPRLPWAMALPELKKDPLPILPILMELRDDESEYVRKSVANNLNDISKDHPELAMKIFREWYGKSERTDRIIKHASRTLLKAGNKEAMKIFGYADASEIKISGFTCGETKLKIGEELKYSFTMVVSGKGKHNIRLEYEMDYVKAKSKRTQKVFKICESFYEPGEYTFKRKHSFKKITTRKYYPGTHKITLIVNGEKNKSLFFDLF